MTLRTKFLSTAASCALALIGSVHAAPLSVPGRVWTETKTLTAPALFAPIAAPTERIALDAPSTAERQVKRATVGTPSGGPRPLQIGFNRSLSDAQRSLAGARLPWQALPDGSHVAHVSVQSHAAAAIRVQLSVVGSGGGEVRFASPANAHEVYGPFALDGQVWSPVIDGDTLLLELRLAPGREVALVTATLDTVAHLEQAAARARSSESPSDSSIGGSGVCEVDVVCTSNASPALLAVEKAVAKMIFTTSEGTFLCSGTLLSSTDPTLPPYFYTANHCVNTQDAANSLTTLWFFEAPTCGGNTAPNAVQLPGGAQLLYNSQPDDVSFLKLKQRPPANAVYAGWTTETLVPGTNVIGIHHPAGDVKKISRGRTYGYSDFNANGAIIPGSDNKVLLTWTVFGETEGGSSGSGVFTYNAALDQYQLRGGLYGGSQGLACAGPVQDSFYSRFDRAFPALKSFLAP